MTFLKSAPLFTRAAALTPPNPVPPVRGVYAWFFRDIPPCVAVGGCYCGDGLTLLYVGISPKNTQST